MTKYVAQDKLRELLEFLQTKDASNIMDAYHGKMPWYDIRFLEEEEVSIILMLRILDRVLKEKI